MMFSLEDISFRYRDKDAISNCSFEIANREVIGVLGPNGAGKSTLIKIIAGILKPYTGELLFEGSSYEVIGQRALSKRIAFVPQKSSIPFSFTAFEIVLMGRTPHLNFLGLESKRDVELALEAMALTDTAHLAGRGADSLSGGELQRIILARAIAQDADVLILDEPTTFLDLKHQADLIKYLKKRNGENGVTIIMALHDINIAANLCSRIVLLKDGRIIEDLADPNHLTAEIFKSTFSVDLKMIKDDMGKTVFTL